MNTADVPVQVGDGLRLERPEHCPTEFHDLMKSAWSAEPKDRPTFKSVREQLQKLDEEVCRCRGYREGEVIPNILFS